MKKIITIVVAATVLIFAVVFALSLSSAPPTIRVNINTSMLTEFQVQPDSFLEKISQSLKISRPKPSRPPVGTRLTMDVSAYAPSPYQTDATPCVTAAGTRVRPGVVATKILPFGAVLEIKTGKLTSRRLIVEDRMNARFTHAMDIWFESTDTALAFGREKQIEVEIIDYGEPGERISGAPRESFSTLEKIKAGWSSISRLLRAQVNPDINKHDVDCIS